VSKDNVFSAASVIPALLPQPDTPENVHLLQVCLHPFLGEYSFFWESFKGGAPYFFLPIRPCSSQVGWGKVNEILGKGRPCGSLTGE
jgi:hypothetical protein